MTSNDHSGLPVAACRSRLGEALAILGRAGLEVAPGLCPPGWNASAALQQAMCDAGLHWLASARDLDTPVQADAVTAGSGLRGVSLLFPQPVCAGRLLHFTTNFQATSTLPRAEAVIAQGGLLAIKAHAVKDALGHRALDGLDEAYRDSLHATFCALEDRWGDALCWTSMDEVAARWVAQRVEPVA